MERGHEVPIFRSTDELQRGIRRVSIESVIEILLCVSGEKPGEGGKG